jgi:hypothetical protein
MDGQRENCVRLGLRPKIGDDKWDPLVRGRRRGSRTGSGKGPDGPWASSGAGLEGSPATSFHIFFVLLFFFFLFSLLFITFAKLTQNHSNQFLNSSKIQSNVLNQQNMFSKINRRFSTKPSELCIKGLLA